jgi:hypothetical protein
MEEEPATETLYVSNVHQTMGNLKNNSDVIVTLVRCSLAFAKIL